MLQSVSKIGFSQFDPDLREIFPILDLCGGHVTAPNLYLSAAGDCWALGSQQNNMDRSNMEISMS